MWTRFMDMHSGGGTKEEPYEYIYIEAAEAEARIIFYNRFHHSPDRVTCTCCGEDYVYHDSDSLEDLTRHDRERHGHCTVEEEVARTNVLVVSAGEIKPGERVGDVSDQGLIWQD